jgi:hypothetical protein
MGMSRRLWSSLVAALLGLGTVVGVVGVGPGCAPSPVSGADAGGRGDDAVVDGGFDGGQVPDGAADAGGQGRPDAGSDVDVGDAGEAEGDAGTVDAGAVDAGADDGGLTGCAADLQDLAGRGGPQGIVGAYGARLLPDCLGTRHQEWRGVQRVVFVGDSVTVGTPPADLVSLASVGSAVTDIVTDVDESYRSRLSDALATHFGLDGPGLTWRGWNPLAQGEALQRSSGDFWNCARWGSKTRDLAGQIENCFPDSQRDKKTMVVFTSGGNDLVDLVDMAADGDSDDAIWARAERTVADLEAAIEHLKDTSAFPAGNLVLFGTPFEYTDWSGDVTSCSAASASGVAEVTDPEKIALLKAIFDWLSVAYLGVAERQGADVAFLLEAMCGHGFRRDDPSLPCYRGPDAERFLDLTCIHPNVRGHQELVARFSALVGAE